MKLVFNGKKKLAMLLIVGEQDVVSPCSLTVVEAAIPDGRKSLGLPGES